MLKQARYLWDIIRMGLFCGSFAGGVRHHVTNMLLTAMLGDNKANTKMGLSTWSDSLQSVLELFPKQRLHLAYAIAAHRRLKT